MAEINVTPLVDVMLVLLIVFMVTAPLLTTGVAVDLPQASSSSLPGQDEPLAVTVSASGKIYVQDTAIKLDQLGPRLRAITQRKPDAQDLRSRRQGDRLRHDDGGGERHQPGRLQEGGPADRAAAAAADSGGVERHALTMPSGRPRVGVGRERATPCAARC